MVLTKVITDAKDHITGTPKKFDPMQMMRDRRGSKGSRKVALAAPASEIIRIASKS